MARKNGTPTTDGVQHPLVTQVPSTGVLLDLQVVAVARSAFPQLHKLRKLRAFPSDSDSGPHHPNYTTAKCYVGLPLKTTWKLQLLQNVSSHLLTGVGARSTTRAPSFPGAIQGAGFDQ